MNRQFLTHKKRCRRGITLVSAVLLIGIMLGMIALAADVGHIVLLRTQLQASADSAATAAAASMDRPRNQMMHVVQRCVRYHSSEGGKVGLKSEDVEYGIWDAGTRTFTPSQSTGNAVRVTARTDGPATGESPLLFAGILDKLSFTRKASAVAMASPREIAFVVDLSGSMNNDTEPCWATGAIDGTFAAEGRPALGTELMQQLYDDFEFGSYPGVLEYLGRPWEVSQNKYAYAELTANGGPLTRINVPQNYRIKPGDDEKTRKQRAYSAIIDHQITRVMPNAKPTPDSSVNYAYWEKYLDYLIDSVWVESRGRLPPSQDRDRIDGFGNPGSKTFPQVGRDLPGSFRNQIGYRTYVQFMMDYGRDLKPEGSNYVALSRHSPDCPWHWEETAGGRFRFPPREQPTHAVRRALIAALQVIREHNSGISDPNQRDWVSIITFDRLDGGGPIIAQPLTPDYHQAMQACTRLQAVGDKSASTAIEAGMVTAEEHLRAKDSGGQGRRATNKVVLLLTDGVANLYVSDPSDVTQFIARGASDDFYRNGAYWYDAPLMQAVQMQAAGWYVFGVGVGLGADYGFVDRLARAGGTSDGNGQSTRGTGNPAQYEQRLTEILEKIFNNPKVRLVR